MLLCIAVLATACRPVHSAPAVPTALVTNATMISVVDGGTIDVNIDGHRERSVDRDRHAETKKPNTPVQCYGPEATKFTSRCSSRRLHLARRGCRDDFGRMLAYVYLAGDGTFVNMAIIRKGFARVLTIRPNAAHADEFVAAPSAQADNIGLWAKCTG